MPGPVTPEVYYKVLMFLENKWSHSMIIKELKRQKIKITSGTISNIKKRSKNKEKFIKNTANCGRKTVLSERQLSSLRVMVNKTNPLTQKAMANKLGTTRNVVKYQIKYNLNKKLVKKPKCHQLNAQTI